MLKTIEEHNAEILENEKKKREALYNTGVACPDCGKELKFVDPYGMKLSSPPKKAVKCECGYRHYIFVGGRI